MSQKVIPVGAKLLIKQKEADKYFAGTEIIIPDTARKKEYKGIVVGVGKSVTEINIGDVVQYSDHCLPTTMMHDNEEHLLINEGDVFAIIKNV
jgi:co-chaperonin GroES (HSP10)